MPKYLIKEGPLDHDGKRYEAGTTVELTEEQAEALSGVVETIEKKGKAE